MPIREIHDEDLEAFFMHQLEPEALGSIRVLEKCGFRRLPVDVQAPASKCRRWY
jgi:RimJ/RimL family protein N-acetyltransferase